MVQLRLNGQSISIHEADEKGGRCRDYGYQSRDYPSKATPISNRTLTTAIDAWISSKVARLSPATVRGYRTCQRNGFPTLMHRKCGSITGKMIEQAVNTECRRYSAKTMTNRWRFIQQVLSWNTGWQYNVKLPQILQPDIDFLDRVDLDQFLRHVHGTKNKIMSLLALSSLRRSEIAALNWEHVDLEHRWIHVRGAMVPDENHQMIIKATNKNDTSRRDIPIIAPLYKALSAEENKQGRFVPLHPTTILTRINKACADAGVPQVGCHNLRHSFASLCHVLKIPQQAATEIGGWSDRATMDRIYTHVSRCDMGSYQSDFTRYFDKNANEK